jgi:hypothetical protein
VDWHVADSALIRKAQDKFFITTEVEGFLNVQESPELVTGLRSLYNSVRNPTRIAGVRGLGSHLKKSSKILAGGYLYYQFGVAPLISDMRKISKSLKVFKDQMERAIKRAGTVYTVHEMCTGTVNPLLKVNNIGAYPAYYGSSPSDNNGKWWHTNITSLVKPAKIATVKGIRSIRFDGSGGDLFGSLGYLIDRFGANGPASYLWERIPFSFVVDWFVDLSGVINGLDRALTGSSRSIVDTCISEKWKVLGPVIHHVPVGYPSSVYNGDQTALVELSSYTRKPFIPTTTVGLSGRFGKKQILLSGALLASICANLKRFR